MLLYPGGVTKSSILNGFTLGIRSPPPDVGTRGEGDLVCFEAGPAAKWGLRVVFLGNWEEVFRSATAKSWDLLLREEAKVLPPRGPSLALDSLPNDGTMGVIPIIAGDCMSSSLTLLDCLCIMTFLLLYELCTISAYSYRDTSLIVVPTPPVWLMSLLLCIFECKDEE